MSVPSYRGSKDFELIREFPTANHDRPDDLVITLDGSDDNAAAAFALYQAGTTTAASLGEGYPNMVLKTKGVDRTGVYPKLNLFFTGFLEAAANRNALISPSNSISEMSVSLTTTNAGDGTIQANYLGQSSTYRWMHWDEEEPEGPRYPQVINPGSINTLQLYNFFPANFTGSLKVKKNGAMTRFDTFRITEKGPWAVVETWTNRLEPDITFTIETPAA